MNELNCPILLVDDEEHFLSAAKIILSGAGLGPVDTESDSRNVGKRLSQKQYAIVALDMNMPHLSGRELLEQISGSHPEILVLIITGDNEIHTAVECMKAGAFDYIQKPVNQETLVARIGQAIQHAKLRTEAQNLKEYLLSGKLRHPHIFENITTRSDAMAKIFEYTEAIAATGFPVLITGETGTGKELVAKALHQLYSPKGPYVAVNTAGLDDAVFSDTLFGHIRGAFTGADHERKGLIEEATGGTLFLDEIGHLRMDSQLKLLRLIQEGEYFPIGSDRPKRALARLVFASNNDISADPSFRKDLYFRLKTHQIHLPPLRERREDIPLLIRRFWTEACKSLQKEVPSFPEEAFSYFVGQKFPGNIRELKALIFDIVGSHREGSITLTQIKKWFPEKVISSEPLKEKGVSFPHELPSLKEVEQLAIVEALKRSGNNKSVAAAMLGITRQTLATRLKEV